MQIPVLSEKLRMLINHYISVKCAITKAWEMARGSEAKADIREIAGSSIYIVVHRVQEIDLAGATILITRKLRLDPKDRKYLAVFKQKMTWPGLYFEWSSNCRENMDLRRQT